ncbi:MAG TPA: Uma2 family endonuclease [Gemmataceae bacterium]|nr:Uma2 family endonuclease [Gemmataceae bacterium]
MATVPVPAPRPRFKTVAELQAYLGDIPAERIRLDPLPGQATEEDVLTILAKEDRICELIDGILVEKPMASFESRLAIILAHFLELFLEEHDLGAVLGEAGFLRLFPGCIRAPDVSFISWKRMPNQEFPDEAIASLAPDLAVEVLSASNTEREMGQKIEEYFQAGGKLVWIVDPVARTVRVYTSPHRSTLLTEDDTLDGRRVLPGFSLPIRKWFARASRRPRG